MQQATLFQHWIIAVIGIAISLITIFFWHPLPIVIKLSLASTGIGLLVGYCYWQHLIAQPHIQTGFQQFRARVPEYNQLTSPFVRNWFVLLGVVFCLLIITEYISNTTLGQQSWWTTGIIGENGFWENLEVFILFVSLVAYLHFFFYHRKLPRGWLTALVICGFTLLLIWVMGEETGWGQVWFGFATPAGMKAHSVAGTFTVHELVVDGEDLNEVAGVAVNWLFVCYCCLLPLLIFFFTDVRFMLQQLRLPVPHLAFSFWAILAAIFEIDSVSLAVMGIPHETFPWSLSEIRETILYLLFLGAVLYSTRFWTYATKDAAI